MGADVGKPLAVASADQAANAERVPPTETEQLCLRLVYRAIQQALAKTKADEPVDPELLDLMHKLANAPKEPPVCGLSPQAVALAVACWLRDKNEIGNRTVAAQLLGICARLHPCQPYCRAAATKVLALPNDLMDVLDICRNATGKEDTEKKPGPPHCLKKAANDFYARLTPFQAAKYDQSSTSRRLRKELKAKSELLQKVESGEVNPATLASKGKGKGKGKGRRAGKGASDSLEEQFGAKELKRQVDNLRARAEKLKHSSLVGAANCCHVSSCPAEIFYGLKRLRYPETPEEFAESGLTGEFDGERSGMRMKLWAELGEATTWDRELSKHGNVITTWRDLLTKKQVPYMAMLRNLNNIIMQGFSLGFLEKYVFNKLCDDRQIRNSGQTAQQIMHSLSAVEEAYTEEKLEEMAAKSKEHVAMICVCHKLLRRLRSEGLVGGRSDAVPGLIGEFLGEPIWKAAGFPLDRVNGVFMSYEEKEVRGDAKRITVSRIAVPINPPTADTIDAVRRALHKAAELAAVAVVEEITWSPQGRVFLWYDRSAEEADALSTTSAAAEDPCNPEADLSQVVQLEAGGMVPLEQISTCTRFCFELRYCSNATVDFNLHAYNRKGQWLFNSTYRDSRRGGEKWNKQGQKIAIHSEDVKGGNPAVRCLHVDLGGMTELGAAPGAAEQEASLCHFVFCMDDSGSMQGRPWEELVKAYNAFLDDRLKQSEDDVVSLVVFNSSSRIEVTGAPLKSRPQPKFKSGGTAFGPPLEDSIKVISEVADGTPILVFMSDGCAGDTTKSFPAAKRMREMFDDQGLQTHFVGFGQGVNEEELRSMARESAGLHHPAKDGGQLLSIFSDIAVTTSAAVSDKKVFALMLSSQNFEGQAPSKASISFRECDYSFDDLKAGYNPETFWKTQKRGSTLLMSDVSEVMQSHGTCIHGMMYKSSSAGWMYRNAVDESLQAESKMAYQATRVCSQIFKSVFGSLSLKSTFDPEKTAAMRICQLRHAFRKHSSLQTVITGVPYTSHDKQPVAKETSLSGSIIEDFTSLYETGRTMSTRFVDPSTLMMNARPGDLVIRVASNAAVPAVPRGVQYAQIDVRGEAVKHLEQIPSRSIVLPGGAEACIKLLRNCLLKEGAGLLDHVTSFLPPNKPPRGKDEPRQTPTSSNTASS